MIKFIKEKIKEWKFNRELKQLMRLPVLVIETTTYVEVEPVKKQKKAKKNVKKHR